MSKRKQKILWEVNGIILLVVFTGNFGVILLLLEEEASVTSGLHFAATF